MLKNLSSLVHKVGDKTYQFICDPDSPLEHVEEVLSQFLDYVKKLHESIKAQQVEASKAVEEAAVQKKE